MPIIELASVSRTSLSSAPGIGGLPETVAASCAQRRGCLKFWGSTGETLATDIQPKLPDPRGTTTWSPQPPTSTSMPACSGFAMGRRCPKTKRSPAWLESTCATKLQALLLIHDCIDEETLESAYSGLQNMNDIRRLSRPAQIGRQQNNVSSVYLPRYAGIHSFHVLTGAQCETPTSFRGNFESAVTT